MIFTILTIKACPITMKLYEKRFAKVSAESLAAFLPTHCQGKLKNSEIAPAFH